MNLNMSENLEQRVKCLETQNRRLSLALNELQSKLESLQRILATASVQPMSSSNPVTTAKAERLNNPLIPESLNKTLSVISQKRNGMITSDDVSKVTGRSRHLESGYLCRLYEKHLVDRNRVGKKVYYSVSTIIDRKN